jgi:maltooligosyltrehalose synthase
VAGQAWTNPLTLETIASGADGVDAAEVFATLPVALLVAPPAG